MRPDGSIRARSAVPLSLSTPRPGWVEQDPAEVVAAAEAAITAVLAQLDGEPVAALGVSNQRESILLWDRATGRAVSPVISWQDRRAREVAERLTVAGQGPMVRRISGLPLDPMFSAAKATWLLDAHDRKRRQSAAGALCLGTVDSWITWNLTGQHVTEPGNASRTSLLDLATADWSAELLDLFEVPRACLPDIGPSARSDLTMSRGPLAGLPLSGLVGDSHAALFAHGGWRTGVVKATLGTGSSVMATVDSDVDAYGLCRSIAWQLPDTAPRLALEGNILAAGAALAWLAGVLGIPADDLAREAGGETSTTFVPAFDGLGAPWWDPGAVGIISGLSLATTRADLARSALDAVVMQVSDVVSALRDHGAPLTVMVVDGGMSANIRLVQDLADMASISVEASDSPDASALGAARLAGLGIGLWSLAELDSEANANRLFEPSADEVMRRRRRATWAHGLDRSRGLATMGEGHD